MKANTITAIAAVALLCCGLASCKGRRADATPNGETVDVVIEPTVVLEDTLPVADDGANTQEGEVSQSEDVPLP